MFAFDEIKFISKGFKDKYTRFRLRHIQFGGVSKTNFPTISPSPTTTPLTSIPSLSSSPTTSSPTSSPPTLMPSTEEQYMENTVAVLLYSFIDGILLVIGAILDYF